MALTARQVETARPKEKDYKLSDERGLYLLVKTTGARYWRLKYRIAGKEKKLALGVYPDVSLAEARIKRDDARKIISEHLGQDTVSEIIIESQSWYNPELKSRYFILPSSIAIIMTLIGMLLTALVIAREWERGTMEALLTTKASKLQIISAKYIAYYCLAIISADFCTFLSVVVFDVPFRGSYLIYLLTASLFLLPSLGMGFIISTIAKNQFLAAVTAAMFGFLPAIMLSGGLFEIASMPSSIRAITYIIPATYFIPIIKNLFMVGNIKNFRLSGLIRKIVP